MQGFLLALQFLTIIPVKVNPNIRKEDFGKALAYFPVVGAVIAGLLILVLFIFNQFHQIAIAALLVAGSLAITGGMHADGFSDTCDGLYGFKTREKALEVMRDSHIGAIGVVAIFALLLLKFAFLSNIPRELLWKNLIFMAVFARWSQVLACFTSKYVRNEGKAKHFIEQAGKKEFIISTVFTVVISLVVMGFKGVVLFLLSLFLVLVFINWIKRKIGGMTGDTIGAVSEVSEVLALLVGVILIG